MRKYELSTASHLCDFCETPPPYVYQTIQYLGLIKKLVRSKYCICALTCSVFSSKYFHTVLIFDIELILYIVSNCLCSFCRWRLFVTTVNGRSGKRRNGATSVQHLRPQSSGGSLAQVQTLGWQVAAPDWTSDHGPHADRQAQVSNRRC